MKIIKYLLLFICLNFGGDLTGGFEDADGFDENTYEEDPKETYQQEQVIPPPEKNELGIPKIDPNKLALLRSFIVSLDTMQCDSLFHLRNKLLEKEHTAKEEVTSDLYSFLVDVVMDKARKKRCPLVSDSVEGHNE